MTIRSSIAGDAPIRPIIIFQSDDWGRVGLPSLAVLDRLQAMGLAVGGSPWDTYGLETEEDLLALGQTLAEFQDADGRPPVFTANFVMANADLRRMREENFTSFRWVPIGEGFPEPWSDRLAEAYQQNVARGVFYPGLHGFTHFNIPRLMRAIGESSALGDLTRILVGHDVPYLASLTPEFNFALVGRAAGKEVFLEEREQDGWVKQGAQLFADFFGFPPRTTCAPGYRANPTTFKLWQREGIEAVQLVGKSNLSKRRPLQFGRNVHFEPTLDSDSTPALALTAARKAVARGRPVIVSSHSINYITRHRDRASEGRAALRELISLLLEEFPSLRFASDADLIDAAVGRTKGWFRTPTVGEFAHRGIAHVGAN